MTDFDVSTEIWKPVSGWENRYEVSNQGRVKALCAYGPFPANRILKPRLNEWGYLVVQLNNPPRRLTCKVHRLVTEAFLGPLRQGWHTNHKNGIKTDNRLENLEYCTPWDNLNHASRLGLMATGERHGSRTKPESIRRGQYNGSSKLTDQQAVHIRRMAQEGYQQNWIAVFYNVGRMTIQGIIHRHSWKHL